MTHKRRALVVDKGGAAYRDLRGGDFLGWEFRHASNADEAKKLLAALHIDVGLFVIEDADPEALEQIESQLAHADLEWIALVRRSALSNPALRTLLGRAFYDFHTLPLDMPRLSVTIGRAHGKSLLVRPLESTNDDAGRFGLTGHSPPMLDLYRQIEKILSVDAPVFISGESGSGKELVARAIHEFSARAEGPFEAMNCAALPHTLMLSELFGHEKGSFTGAHKRKIGRIEAAHGGLLFLDEIGDLPLEVQSYLLRFLEERSIVRIGSTQHLHVDVRVIAATHVDLQLALQQGQFRDDLYYRLHVLQLKVPPLRSRGGDIPLIAEAMFARFADQKSPRVKGFSVAALKAMAAHDWPGNVRELMNRVRQAMVMCDHRLIGPADLGLPTKSQRPQTLEEARSSIEREMIETSLAKNGKNLSEAARQLGISRVTLYKMIERLKIVL